MQGEYTIKAIQNAIFHYKDISFKAEKKQLIKVLKHELKLLESEIKGEI